MMVKSIVDGDNSTMSTMVKNMWDNSIYGVLKIC